MNVIIKNMPEAQPSHLTHTMYFQCSTLFEYTE